MLSHHVEHISWWLLLLSVVGAAVALKIVWSSTEDD
jgi:hypothetical protein